MNEFMLDLYKNMTTAQLINEYNNFKYETAQREVMAKAILSRNALILLLKEMYSRSPSAQLKQSVFGDWHCHGDCERCKHKDGELANAFGKWIDSLCDWKLFITMTFNTKRIAERSKIKDWSQIGSKFCQSAFLKFIEHIEECEIQDGKIDKLATTDYVVGLERQTRGDYHCHALLGSVDHTNVKNLIEWKMWLDREYGFSSFYIYERNRGANFYLCKYLVKDGHLLIRVNGEDDRECYTTQNQLKSAIPDRLVM